jgi:pentose-5-phosphate-3-epimerase
MIIPTIFEKDFSEVQTKIKLIEGAVEKVQIDIADGVFVDGITFQDTQLLNTLDTKLGIELDLQVENPLTYIQKKLDNVTSVCAPVEADMYIEDFITIAKQHVYDVGLSISPGNSCRNYRTISGYNRLCAVFHCKAGRSGKAF